MTLRLSRRRVLAAGAAASAAAAGIAVAGCGESSGRKPVATATPAPGGELRYGTSLAIRSGLDPQIESGSGLTIVPKIYGYLFHVDPRDDSLILDHAESVEQPDATTWIIRLRGDVRFHDVPPVNGRAVTAGDAVRSIERFRDNALVVNKTWHASVLDRVEALDERTLRVTTKRPYVYTLGALGALDAGAILPREVIEGNTDLATRGAGSGPFVVDDVALPSRVRLRRHPGYFAPPLPYVDATAWSIFASDDERRAAFSERRIDVMPNRDGPEARATAEISTDVEVTSEPSLAYLSLGMRVDRPPFTDARVRQAIDIGIDRAEMIRDIAFEDGDLLGPVNPHLADAYWSLPREEIVAAQSGGVAVEERRAQARQLLVAAAAQDAVFTLRVANEPQLVDVAAVLRNQLQLIGLTANITVLDVTAWFVGYRRGDFDATVISQLPYESPDGPTRLYHSGGSDGGGNQFGFGDAAIDGLIERSWGQSDRAERRATLLDAQRLMLAARPLAQLFTGVGYTSAWDYVRGRRPELPGSLAQYNYAQWLALPLDGRP